MGWLYRRLADFVSCLNSCGSRFAARCIVAKNNAEGVTGANLIADLYFCNETDTRIDFVFDAHAATAGLGDGVSDFGGTNFRDESGARRFYLKRFVCQRQNPGGFVTDPRLSALGRDIGAKCFQRRSGFVQDSITRAKLTGMEVAQ